MSEVVRIPGEAGTVEDTWSALPAGQQPEWPDTNALSAVVSELRSYPPLVFAGEADQLKDRIAAVAKGEAFLLTGGDCAETFAGNTADAIRASSRRCCRWPSSSPTRPRCRW